MPQFYLPGVNAWCWPLLCQPLNTKVNSFMLSKPEAPKETEPLGFLTDVKAVVAPLAQIIELGSGQLGTGGDPGNGLGKVSKEPLAVVLIDEFVFFFHWQDCEFLSLSYWCLNISAQLCQARFQPGAMSSQSSRICFLCLGNSWDSVGVSYLAGSWGKVGSGPSLVPKTREWGSQPPSNHHPSCPKGFGLESVFSTLEPYLSPYPDYTCLDIVYLFRPYMMVFCTKFTRKDIGLIVGGQQGRG